MNQALEQAVNNLAPETPCVLIDSGVMNRNIAKMAEAAKTHGVNLRPHAKTHKMPEIALQQIEAGAVGITVAKLSEAEVMAEGGIRDIFVAYPVVGAGKAKRAVALSQRITLTVGVDSLAGAQRLAAAAEQQGTELRVRLEIDTGYRRTGVAYDDAIRIAQQIHGLHGLRLTGIFTFRGSFMNGKSTMDWASAGLEEGQMMARLAESMRACGLPIHEVSVGSTPTGIAAASVPGVTEIRPGTYVFQDRMQSRLGLCTLDECAASVLVTVVSRPSPELVIIDGGSKTFATDVQPNTEPLRLEGFGHIIGYPGAVLERLSEEHGMIRAAAHHDLKVGDTLRIIPNHICSTVNLHNKVYLWDIDRFSEISVRARGMLK